LDEAGVSVALLDRDGSISQRFGHSLTFPESVDLKQGFKTILNEDGRWRVYVREISRVNNRPAGWLRVAHSLQSVDATLRYLINYHLLKIPLLLSMIGLGGFLLANRALKPIGQITRMAERVMVSGDLTQRLNYRGAADELERLATMFDDMLDSLQATFEREKRFIADASHELRTPLTAIKGRLHVTLRQLRGAEDYQDTLEAIEQEVDRLISLSSDLLLLSRLEQQSLELKLEPIDLSDLLAAIAEQIQPLADLHHLKFSTHIAPDLRIQGSPDHLIRLFLNLLDNAVKYTPEYGEVNLMAKCNNHAIQAIVQDTGIGIASEHLSHLFERFYRVEKSRSRAVGGTGLGLAIAQEIIHLHKGAISVKSQVGRGTTVTVTIPTGLIPFLSL
jgi:signal transduction histidine kinase